MSIAAPIVIAAFFGAIFGSGQDKPTPDRDRRSPTTTRARCRRRSRPRSQPIRRSTSSNATRRRRSRSRAAARCARRSSCPPASARRRPRLCRRRAKPAVAVHYDPSQATAMPLVRGLLAQHAMQAIGAGSAVPPAAHGRRGAAFSLPFTTGQSSRERAATCRTTATRTRSPAWACSSSSSWAIEVGVGVLLARRLRLVEAAARGAALARAPARQPHRERRDHRARPARDHLRGGDRRSSTSAIDGSVAGFVADRGRVRAPDVELRPARSRRSARRPRRRAASRSSRRWSW